VLGPWPFLDLRVQKTSIVLSALLGMPIYFVGFGVQSVEFFGNVLPFVAGFCVLAEC